jgi:hypothetical protein
MSGRFIFKFGNLLVSLCQRMVQVLRYGSVSLGQAV